MLIRTAPLLLAALLLGAAAPAQKAPQKAAPKAAAPAKAQTEGAYDPTNPQSLLNLLATVGAKAAAPRREEDSVFVSLKWAIDFSVQFAGCNSAGRACQAVLFDGLAGAGAPTLAQINGFNQTSVVCRIYQDKAGKPHVTYATLIMKSDTRDSGRTHLAAWQGCLTEAAGFVRDPTGYLAVAP